MGLEHLVLSTEHIARAALRLALLIVLCALFAGALSHGCGP